MSLEFPGIDIDRIHLKIQTKENYRKMADFGCYLCFHLGYGTGTPAEIHHIRRTSKRSNAPAIPLCPEHHRGNNGIHGMGRKAFEKRYAITEEDMLDRINAKLNLENNTFINL